MEAKTITKTTIWIGLSVVYFIWFYWGVDQLPKNTDFEVFLSPSAGFLLHLIIIFMVPWSLLGISSFINRGDSNTRMLWDLTLPIIPSIFLAALLPGTLGWLVSAFYIGGYWFGLVTFIGVKHLIGNKNLSRNASENDS